MQNFAVLTIPHLRTIPQRWGRTRTSGWGSRVLFPSTCTETQRDPTDGSQIDLQDGSIQPSISPGGDKQQPPGQHEPPHSRASPKGAQAGAVSLHFQSTWHWTPISTTRPQFLFQKGEAWPTAHCFHLSVFLRKLSRAERGEEILREH